ncbi:hypothetical protein AB0G60_02480 [Streptomyces angustmyceticus]|uniref:Uncharacterized protein n=1 Tax=Streptomyces angustmyceticus TaxID=285578 RepID=A0A5J4L6Z0_9ACTN|nr:hypothetical protein [Streptomyces angustmyceticus]UAL65529.1 DUF2793 domain-containing protein [Streptomyces angustmyceticus]GES27952.1 hypothetical protein San01_04390 [Streptomyces angustmyceticus]
MPTTDSYGQGVQVASLTDAPNQQVLAANLAAGLVPRSVMRFSSASARNATIASPAAGMTAFLTTEKLLTVFDGTAWVVVAAGTSAWTTIPLASGYSHDGNSNGTAQYRIVNLFGELTVMLQGGLNLTYPGSPGNIANGGIITNTALPAAARPGSLRTVSAACSASNSSSLSLKIDAQSDGHLKVIGTSSTTASDRVTPPWVSLNGLFYSL